LCDGYKDVYFNNTTDGEAFGSGNLGYLRFNVLGTDFAHVINSNVYTITFTSYKLRLVENVLCKRNKKLSYR